MRIWCEIIMWVRSLIAKKTCTQWHRRGRWWGCPRPASRRPRWTGFLALHSDVFSMQVWLCWQCRVKYEGGIKNSKYLVLSFSFVIICKKNVLFFRSRCVDADLVHQGACWRWRTAGWCGSGRWRRRSPPGTWWRWTTRRGRLPACRTGSAYRPDEQQGFFLSQKSLQFCNTDLSPPCSPEQDGHEDHEKGWEDVGDGGGGEEEVEHGVLWDRVVPAPGEEGLVRFDEATVGDLLSVPVTIGNMSRTTREKKTYVKRRKLTQNWAPQEVQCQVQEANREQPSTWATLAAWAHLGRSLRPPPASPSCRPLCQGTPCWPAPIARRPRGPRTPPRSRSSSSSSSAAVGRSWLWQKKRYKKKILLKVIFTFPCLDQQQIQRQSLNQKLKEQRLLERTHQQQSHVIAGCFRRPLRNPSWSLPGLRAFLTSRREQRELVQSWQRTALSPMWPPGWCRSACTESVLCSRSCWRAVSRSEAPGSDKGFPPWATWEAASVCRGSCTASRWTTGAGSSGSSQRRQPSESEIDCQSFGKTAPGTLPGHLAPWHGTWHQHIPDTTFPRQAMMWDQLGASPRTPAEQTDTPVGPWAIMSSMYLIENDFVGPTLEQVTQSQRGGLGSALWDKRDSPGGRFLHCTFDNRYWVWLRPFKRSPPKSVMPKSAA